MNRAVPFPFTLMFQNGPRRQGSASPRKNPRALDRSGPFRRFSRHKGKGTNAKTLFAARFRLPLVGIERRELVWSRQNIVGGLKSTV
jgi:hypothetical protein